MIKIWNPGCKHIIYKLGAIKQQTNERMLKPSLPHGLLGYSGPLAVKSLWLGLYEVFIFNLYEVFNFNSIRLLQQIAHKELKDAVPVSSLR